MSRFYIGLQPEGTPLTASLHGQKNRKSVMHGLKRKKMMGIFNQRYLNHMSHYSPSEYDF